MPSDPESTNPFVRFKHLVDDQISQTVRSIWSLPASCSSSSPPSTKAIQDHEGNTFPIRSSSGPPFVILDKLSSEDSNALTELYKETYGHAPTNEDPPFDRERDVLEAAVDRSLRDQTIHSWVRYSAYSPLRLQDTLPQPIPKDVPASSPSNNNPQAQSRFTFKDAFEDLLAVSSGQPLKPVAELESRPTTLRRHGSLLPEPRRSARSWRDWTASLERRWLWDTYFEPESFWPVARRIVTIATSDLSRRELTADQAERYIHKFVRDAAACDEERRWRRADLFMPGGLGFGGRAATWPGLGALLGLQGGAGVLDDDDDDEIEQHPLTRLLAAGAREVFASDGKAERRRRPDAETDEDLYRNVESDYARSRRPRRLDMSQPREDKEAPSSAVARHSTQGGESGSITKYGSDNSKNDEWTEEFPEPDGGKTVKSVARKVGPWMSHETVTTTRYDADGNVIQRMSQRQHSASKEFRWSSSSGSGEDGEKTDGSEEKNKSSSGKGWFWTK